MKIYTQDSQIENFNEKLTIAIVYTPGAFFVLKALPPKNNAGAL
jgi:hypothetical protein